MLHHKEQIEVVELRIAVVELHHKKHHHGRHHQVPGWNQRRPACLEILKQEESQRPIMNLQHKMLAEGLQHEMLAVKMGQKVEKVQVGVIVEIVERDLHQERSQRLVASDVKPESRLRKEERDRKLFRRIEMTSKGRGHIDRVMAVQASPMMS